MRVIENFFFLAFIFLSPPHSLGSKITAQWGIQSSLTNTSPQMENVAPNQNTNTITANLVAHRKIRNLEKQSEQSSCNVLLMKAIPHQKAHAAKNRYVDTSKHLKISLIMNQPPNLAPDHPHRPAPRAQDDYLLQDVRPLHHGVSFFRYRLALGPSTWTSTSPSSTRRWSVERLMWCSAQNCELLFHPL